MPHVNEKTSTWIAVVLIILGLLIGLLIRQIWDVKANATENREAITKNQLLMMTISADLKYIREKIDRLTVRMDWNDKR